MPRFAFIAAAFFALIAGACSSGSTPAPSPTPSTTGTAAATATAPAPTATPASPAPTATVATPTPTATATAARTPTPPAATATPTRATPPTATPPPASGRLLTNGPRDSGLVALTFDMGGRVEPALDIMNWLITNRVHATIFMTGAMAENQNTGAGREVLRLVAAHPELFALGNHSDTHPDFTTLGAAAMRAELERTEAAIARIVATSPRPFFRPPFGAQNAAVVSAVAAAGYPFTVMWDIDTIDWRPESEGGPTAAAIVAKVRANARGGSIVLMHLGGYNTLDALPGILAALREAGLTPATLSEMVR